MGVPDDDEDDASPDDDELAVPDELAELPLAEPPLSVLHPRARNREAKTKRGAFCIRRGYRRM